MNTTLKRLSSLCATAMLVLGTGAPAVADDTELFLAPPPPAAGANSNPNILLVLDTSGSMGDAISTQSSWDPSVIWPGCYDPLHVYYQNGQGVLNGSPCGNNLWFNRTALQCDAADTALDDLGQWQGNAQAWRAQNRRWVDLNPTEKDRDVECEDDRGVHGNGGGDLFAAHGSDGPWHSDFSREPVWNKDYTLYNGNWLNWYNSGATVSKTKLQIMQEVLDDLLSNINNVNVGLMHFNNPDEGGPVSHEIDDISVARATLIAQIKGFIADGYTPLSETMFEAGQYYRGTAVDYGNVGPVMSVANSRNGGAGAANYQTPINYPCQKNYIVYLSDGLPTRDVSADAKITGLPGFNTLVSPACDGTGDGACLDDMADYLYTADLNTNANMSGIQNVTTYTIGFDQNIPILETAAQRGGGKYYQADDAATLTGVLIRIVLNILDDASIFSAPAVPVNAFNRTTNLNDVFVSVFKPTSTLHWPGNLKKYRLTGGVLVDQTGTAAIDPGTGFFATSASSYWTTGVDGDDARLGGSAHELPLYLTRKLYTNIAGGDLNSLGNAVDTSNPAITTPLLGSPPFGERDNVINWARGLDLNDEDDDLDFTDVRHVMGDPLHVRPVSVIYGGTQANPDMVVFTATNDGNLHAIDPDDGTELWSFIPARLMTRLWQLYQDDPTSNKGHGLDGDIRIYIHNDDGLPGISGAERVMLYKGMRRGGDAIYALDVTDRNDPQLVWILDSTRPGFADLGQTWSTPVAVKIDVGGTIEPVLIFGGGYDTGQDAGNYRTDTFGNAVYIVDAMNGTLITSAGNPNAIDSHDLDLNMEHSVPAPVQVIDINRDKLADRLYFGDMGGRVWRIDIFNGNSASNLLEGGMIASLGGADIAGPPANEIRRFFASPDIVPVVTNSNVFLTVNLGSGYRSHPLDTTIDDEFYSVRDFQVFRQLDSSDYTSFYRQADLIDVTNLATPVLETDPGWRLSMVQGVGEKVLGRSVTFDNKTLFTSFEPVSDGSRCVAGAGKNRLYKVDVRSGGPKENLDNSIDPYNLTEDDFQEDLTQTGIAPDPVVLFPEDQPDDPIVCIGVECDDANFNNNPSRTFWTQDGSQ